MLAIAILGAGKGTRMKSGTPKVLHKLAGRTLVERVLNSCRNLKPDRCLMIIGHKGEFVKQNLSHISNLEFVNQEPQKGTGHAIQQLVPTLKNFSGDLLVLNGDVPLLTSQTIQKLLQKHHSSQADVTFLSSFQEKPSGYGRVFSDKEGNVREIIEDKDCSIEQLKNCLTNAGIYCFKWDSLIEILDKLASDNKQKEIYLTDAIEKLNKAVHLKVDDSYEVMGINDKIQLATCEGLLQKRLRNYWMTKGVTFIDPLSCTLSDDCEFGIDVVIEPQTHLRGKCRIGNYCKIGPDSIIYNSNLGNNVTVIKSVIDNSVILNLVKIGPFAHIRPDTEISDNCRIGNFVEIKKSQISFGTKVNHLSYIGDSVLGNNVNIGAGTITANYDGVNKNRTTIGNFTKTGSNSVLVAPLIIGSNVTIGAGSTITKDVPDNALAIERTKQLIKANWSKL